MFKRQVILNNYNLIELRDFYLFTACHLAPYSKKKERVSSGTATSFMGDLNFYVDKMHFKVVNGQITIFSSDSPFVTYKKDDL